MTAAMPRNQLDNVLRLALTADAERLVQLDSTVSKVARRLGLAVGNVRAPRRVPFGSDQVDTGSLAAWLARVEPGDEGATLQVRQIMAAIEAAKAARPKGG